MGWQLGEPDLVVRMAVPFELPAEGVDVYRNFVIPIPVDRPRWVRGMELQPDNRGVVHHAFMLIDRDGECRRLDAQDAKPGFDGMEAEGAESPDGHFISWQPGKVATAAPEGTAWQLTPGTDLVLQMHMQPPGKCERVQASVGLYFTDEPPTRFPGQAGIAIDRDRHPGRRGQLYVRNALHLADRRGIDRRDSARALPGQATGSPRDLAGRHDGRLAANSRLGL